MGEEYSCQETAGLLLMIRRVWYIPLALDENNENKVDV
jgi:hypothetical protein